jgi:hypothetical protein
MGYLRVRMAGPELCQKTKVSQGFRWNWSHAGPGRHAGSRQPGPSRGPNAIALLPKTANISGDINGLNARPRSARRPFLLASHPRILYPMGRLACERPWPCFGLALWHDPEELLAVFRKIMLQ